MARRSDRSGEEGSAGEEPELSPEELDRHRADALPDRAALSILSTDVGIPVDPALAADVLSGLSGGDLDRPGDLPPSTDVADGGNTG